MNLSSLIFTSYLPLYMKSGVHVCTHTYQFGYWTHLHFLHRDIEEHMERIICASTWCRQALRPRALTLLNYYHKMLFHAFMCKRKIFGAARSLGLEYSEYT